MALKPSDNGALAIPVLSVAGNGNEKRVGEHGIGAQRAGEFIAVEARQADVEE